MTLTNSLKKILKVLLLGVFLPCFAFEDGPPLRGMGGPPPQNGDRNMIEGLKSNKQGQVLSLRGSIPNACKEKVALNYFCAANENKITYIFKELTEDGFNCMRMNKRKCLENAENECSSFEEIAKDQKLQTQFNYQIDIYKKESCSKIKIDNTQVVLQNISFHSDTPEGVVCQECQKQKDQIAKLQAQVERLQGMLERQAKAKPGGDLKMAGRKPPSKEEADDEDEEKPERSPRPQTATGDSANRINMSAFPASGYGSYGGYTMMSSPYSNMGSMNMSSMMGMGSTMSTGNMSLMNRGYSSYGSYGGLGYGNRGSYGSLSGYNNNSLYNYFLSTNPLLRGYNGTSGYYR